MSGKESESARIVVFFGMVASGKSHLAKRWARLRHFPYYNTDIVRKELFGLAPQSRQQAGVSQGIYSAERTRDTYREILRRVERDLDLGRKKTIVLDGSYREEEERNRLVSTCGSRCEICFIYCYCCEVETRRRLELRALDPDSVSDGRWEIYLHQKKHFRVPETIDGARLLHLNTERDTDTLIREVEVFLDNTAPVEDRGR